MSQESRARAELLAAVPIPAQRTAVESWLATRNAPRTAEEYAKAALIFVRWLAARGPVDLAAVGELDVTMFMAAQRDRRSAAGTPLSVRTVRHRVAVVSSMLLFLSRQRVRVGNPATDIERPKPPKGGETPVLTEDDMARMWGGTAGRDDVVIGLLYVSLMRVAELERADVRGIITVDGERVLRVRTKGSKIRDVALPPEILDPLLAYLDGRTDGPLILSDRDSRVTRHWVTALLQRVGTAAGVQDAATLRPHMFRASGITHLLNAGVPIQDVQHLAGHEKPETTQDYHRRALGRKRDREVAGMLVQILSGKRAA